MMIETKKKVSENITINGQHNKQNLKPAKQ
jgi:hypothetical protein